TGHPTHDQPQQGADQRTSYNENCHDDDPRRWRWNYRIVREEGDGLWRRGNDDAGPADITNDCGQAAQQACHESHDDCDERAGINGQIETIGRKEIGHRPAMEICLAAIAEKMMDGFAKVAMTVECPAARARLCRAGRMETMYGFFSDQQQLQGW